MLTEGPMIPIDRHSQEICDLAKQMRVIQKRVIAMRTFLRRIVWDGALDPVKYRDLKQKAERLLDEDDEL